MRAQRVLLCTWQWNHVLRKINDMPPTRWRTFNFSSHFSNHDYVSDTPMSSVAPYLLAHFPNARVLLSTRNATQWVTSRTRAHPTGQFTRLVPRPLRWWSDDKKNDATDPAQQEFAALAYVAQNALVACLAPPERFVEVPLDRLCDAGLQRRIAALLGSPCTGCLMPRCPEQLAKHEKCEAEAQGSKRPTHHCAAIISKEQSQHAAQNRLAWAAARKPDAPRGGLDEDARQQSLSAKRA